MNLDAVGLVVWQRFEDTGRRISHTYVFWTRDDHYHASVMREWSSGWMFLGNYQMIRL
jgi:hypothetical protein